MEIITRQAEAVAGSREGGLGLAALAGIGIAVYSSSKGMASLIEGMNEDQRFDLVALVWIGRGDFEPVQGEHGLVYHVQVPGRALAAFGRDATLDDVVNEIEQMGPHTGEEPYAGGYTQALNDVLMALSMLRLKSYSRQMV